MPINQTASTAHTTPKRFSKELVREHINSRISEIENEFGFSQDDGWHQVGGKGEEISRAYGEYDCLLNLTDTFGL